MATERQRSANERNAAKSTGPRSRGGKKRSAQNARTHGLTGPPDEVSILRWYRIIRNDPTAQLRDALESAVTRGALFLAEAEAHLERTRDAERAHLEKMIDIALKRGRRSILELAHVPEKAQFEDNDVLDLMIRNFSRPDRDSKAEDSAFLVGALKIFKRSNPNRPAELNRRMNRFRGYRKRAESRRNRAFTEWLRSYET